MFRRFRPKIRVYENRCHGCSFKATINCLIWNDVELVGLQTCYLGFWKFWKFLKSSKIFNNFFFFFKFSPSKSKFSKNVQYVRGQWLMNMSTKFQVDIFKTGTSHGISGFYRDFPNFIFWPILMLQKVYKVHFFAFFAKIWPKKMYRSSKSRNYFAWPFLPGDLRWPWPLLWSQSTVNNTYKCQRHYPCRLAGFVFA